VVKGESKKLKYLITFRNTSLLFFCLITFFSLSLTLVSIIPDQGIKKNIQESLLLLETEGDYPYVGGNQKNYQLDNFSDSYMLNIVYNIDPSKPLTSIMRNTHFSNSKSKIESLKTQIDQGLDGNMQYPRYWHGYLLTLRPLLTFSTINDIRVINQILFLLLISIIFSLLFTKISKFVAFSFVFSFAMVNFLIVPLSLQFSSSFFITLISIILILLNNGLDEKNAPFLFFIIGSFESFFDLLTVPIITFGMPAIIILILRNKQDAYKSISKELFFTSMIGFSWIVGYTGIWVSKWCLASIILKENILLDGINAVIGRTGGVIPYWLDNGTPLEIHSLTSNIKVLLNFSKPISWLLFYITPIVSLLIFSRWHKKRNALILSGLLLLISFLPYIWFVFASNHSAIHYWFTYRIQVVSIMGSLCAVYYSINWERFVFDIKRYFP